MGLGGDPLSSLRFLRHLRHLRPAVDLRAAADVCASVTVDTPCSNGLVFSDLRATDVIAAADRIRGLVRRTPLVRSDALSESVGGDVYLKLENDQITGSFKLRGALNVLATLPPEARSRGVVASSAGNHGLGVTSCSWISGSF